MGDEHDRDLTRLFAQARESLPSEPFMSDTLRKLRRARRLQWLWRTASIAALLATVGAGAPLFARLSLALGSYSSIGSEYIAAFLVSPAGFVGSLLLGFIVLSWIRWSRY